MLAILAIVFVALPALAQGTEHIVGDYYGWTLNFNYNTWAKGKEFRVGDTIVFNYATGKHNVFKVSGSAFEHCSVPPENEAMVTGNDVITLETPGRKWYICGKAEGKHCWSGMKLLIDVLPASIEHPPVAAPLNSPTWEAPYMSPSYSKWEPPAAAPPTGPRKFFVGDNKGWTLNFNYTAWAQGKEFQVGDILGKFSI
ncbi:mavicyanin-like [Asparagus officinalis]|uniref:mavicyanin-like n=1 Tax=Asparagus officinalis TaxID=4686 RepID=UPI00098DFCB9|nr:mavicyanin-like [Asparagus officinalis]